MDGGVAVGDSGRRRVYLPQALGGDEFLRVTWHEDRRVMVFSHWTGDRCVAATPVRVDDVGELAELVVAAAVRSRTATAPGPWPAPRVSERVDPPVRRTA